MKQDNRPLVISAAIVAVTRWFGFALTAATTLVLAAVLGPSDLGRYYLLTLIPATTLALSFGLPSALTFHAGRTRDLDAVRTSALVLSAIVSLIFVVPIAVGSSLLTTTVFASVPADVLLAATLAIPGAILLAFTNAVTLGRQRIGLYTGVLIANGAGLLAGQSIIVAGLGLGLHGAVWTLVAVYTGCGLASLTVMVRLAPFQWRWEPTYAVVIARYGLKIVPASIAGYFSYRADVFLLSLLARNPSVVGVYGLAVNFAELCFYVPDAAATVLFPRAAASEPSAMRSIIPRITRVTVSLTSAAALLVGLGVALALPLVLPAYSASVVPTLILLPGIVALSASKVLSGYLAGIGQPGSVSAVAMASLTINIVANLILIPRFGAAGAALASLISYGSNGMAMVQLSARDAGTAKRRLVVPQRGDMAIVRDMVRSSLQAVGVK